MSTPYRPPEYFRRTTITPMRKLFENLDGSLIEAIRLTRLIFGNEYFDYISLLHDVAVEQHFKLNYNVRKDPHDNHFICILTSSPDTITVVGEGDTPKKARMDAACLVIHHIKDLQPMPNP